MLVGLILDQIQKNNDISASLKILYLSKTFYIKNQPQGKKFIR